MAENKKAVSLDELSHFKAKQDLYNANTFQKKGESDLNGAVRYDVAQALTEEQKAQARFNIGVSSTGGGGTSEGAVRYDIEQALDDEAKARARANIGAGTGTWADMPDKPFGDTAVLIEWDGNGLGKDIVTLYEEDGSGSYLVKVHDTTTNRSSDFIGAAVELTSAEGSFGGEIEKDNITLLDNNNIAIMVEGELAVVNISAIGSPVSFPDVDVEPLTFPSTGIYFLSYGTSQDHSASTMYVSKLSIDKLTKQLDEIYIPSNIPRLNERNLIPSEYLPSYVDDVVEGYFQESANLFRDAEHNIIVPETGKIYLDVNTGNTYRWSGSTYVRLNPDEITFATTSDIDELFN